MVQYKPHKDGQFWKLHDLWWCREHPGWQKKHLLGPVTFDYMCPECEFMIQDVPCETVEPLRKHWADIHCKPRIAEKLKIIEKEHMSNIGRLGYMEDGEGI